MIGLGRIYEISSVTDADGNPKDSPFIGMKVQIARAKENTSAMLLIEGEDRMIKTSTVKQIDTMIWACNYSFTLHTRNSIYHLEEAY